MFFIDESNPVRRLPARLYQQQVTEQREIQPLPIRQPQWSPGKIVPPPHNTVLTSWKESPYPGLRAFSFEEAAIFFGLRGETDESCCSARECQFLAVIGASETGRSSLVNAGLLPRLAAGAIEGSADWRVVNIRLGSQGAERHPLIPQFSHSLDRF